MIRKKYKYLLLSILIGYVAQSISQEPLKVAFLYQHPVNAGGWSLSHEQGRLDAENEFGDKIKPGTFTLTDNSTATEIRIVDDLNGNLYAPSAPSSSDSNLSLSSSANYVGNIFYELGVFTIVETGSFDGTNNYSEVTSGNFTVNYKGVHNLTTFEYVCTALPNEVNQTQNMSIFKANSAGKLKDNLTGSLFPTYVTEVGLYDDAEDLIGIARLSKPIPKSRKIPMRFFVRMDY